jgi:hypothetical protein
MWRRIAVAVLGTALFVWGCASTINQDSKSGEDNRPSGADEIKIGDDGEASVQDVVTYPGGDRVDWKVFEIKGPKDITVSLRWKPPRENLDLAFNVLDEGFNVLARAKPSPNSGKKKKEVDIKAAGAGKYYVQIYAPERGDAGDYTLEISVRDVAVVDTSNIPKVPDPPRLPALPPPPCPPGTPPDKCPTGSGPAPACPPGAAAGTICACMPGNTPPPCPPPPPKCVAGAPQGTPCICDDGVSPPPCPIANVVVYAQITEVTVAGQSLNVTLNRGTAAKVAKGCTGVVFRGVKGDKELPNSGLTITDVTERESRGNIPKMTLDELGSNRRSRLTCVPKGP